MPTRLVLPVLIAFLTLGACSSSTTSVPSVVECTADKKCACGSAANCSKSCQGTSPAGVAGGGCAFECTSGATCAFACPGGGCTMICSSGAKCTIDCPGGTCATTCENADSCKVTGCKKNCALTCSAQATVCEQNCSVVDGCTKTTE